MWLRSAVAAVQVCALAAGLVAAGPPGQGVEPASGSRVKVPPARWAQGTGRAGRPMYRSLASFARDARHNRLLAVPAGLYAVNNHLKFAMQLYFKPTTAKMLGNLKVAPPPPFWAPPRSALCHPAPQLALCGWHWDPSWLGAFVTAPVPSSADVCRSDRCCDGPPNSVLELKFRCSSAPFFSLTDVSCADT